MKAVILAAGMGVRLRPRTSAVPKCLLEIHGYTLLERSLGAIKDAGMEECIIVLGHLGEMIRAFVGEDFRGMNISYVDSPQYQTTGSAYSLFEAKGVIGESDIVLFESDLLYDPSMVPAALSSIDRNLLLSVPCSGSGDEVYICKDQSGSVRALGKNIPPALRESAIGELVGISRFSNTFLRSMFDRIQDDYESGARQYHYEETAFLVGERTGELKTLLVNVPWVEIDTKNDLRRAAKDVYPKVYG